jgi:hypothetical protein
MRNACKVLARIPKGRRPLVRPRQRQEDNIKIDLRGKSVDWMCVAQDDDQWQALVNTAMILWVP